MRIEIADFSKAITAQLQAIRLDTKAMLAHIKNVSPIMESGRVPVRNNHLSHRHSLNDRTQTTLILIANSVKYQSFARRKAQPELPFLPVHMITIYLKARPIWLCNLKRLE